MHSPSTGFVPPAGRPAGPAARAARWHVVLRILVAVGAGYAFCWGFIALVVAGGFALGLAFHDGEQLASMLAFLLYLAVFLWTFAARSLARVAAVLLGGGALMAGAAWWLQSLLLP